MYSNVSDTRALNAIKRKLIEQVSDQNPGQPEVPPDWPSPRLTRSSSSGSTTSSVQLADLSATVETLKRRSAQTFNPPTHADPAHARRLASTPTGAAATLDPTLYLKQLQSKVEEINRLSSQQERTMGEIEKIQSQFVSTEEHSSGPGHGSALRPQINFADAVIANAKVDARGNVVLAYRPVTWSQSQADALNLAAHLRGTYGSSKRRGSSLLADLGADLGALWQEPAQWLEKGWLSLQTLIPSLSATQRSRAATPFQPHRRAAPVSAVDAMLWGGGGVIGRVALNLILAAFPALWSVAVAAITAITAYALYRATLAPKLEFGLAYRVFLAIGGLILGGYL